MKGSLSTACSVALILATWWLPCPAWAEDEILAKLRTAFEKHALLTDSGSSETDRQAQAIRVEVLDILQKIESLRGAIREDHVRLKVERDRIGEITMIRPRKPTTADAQLAALYLRTLRVQDTEKFAVSAKLLEAVDNFYAQDAARQDAWFGLLMFVSQCADRAYNAQANPGEEYDRHARTKWLLRERVNLRTAKVSFEVLLWAADQHQFSAEGSEIDSPGWQLSVQSLALFQAIERRESQQAGFIPEKVHVRWVAHQIKLIGDLLERQRKAAD